jgi:hypothetical protein
LHYFLAGGFVPGMALGMASGIELGVEKNLPAIVFSNTGNFMP